MDFAAQPKPAAAALCGVGIGVGVGGAHDGKIAYPPGVKEITDKITTDEMIKRLKVRGRINRPPAQPTPAPGLVWSGRRRPRLL